MSPELKKMLISNISKIVIGVAIFVGVLFLVNNNTKLQAKISVLHGKNEILETELKDLKAQRGVIQDSLQKLETQIKNLEESEKKLSSKSKELEVKLKNIKSKYETANNHTANYNADSIRRYFSDFK